MLDWEWFSDTNTAHFFQYCLLAANTTEKEWRGIVIERGAFISSIPNMSKITGLSIQQTRTAIAHLKSTCEITCESTHSYTKINVCNYEKYQLNIKESNTPSNRRSNRQSTDNQHAEQQTINNNIRSIEDIEDKKNNIISLSSDKESEIEISRSDKKKKYSKEQTKLHSECRAIFEEIYLAFRGEKYYWTAKDAGSLVGVLKQISYFMPEEERADYEKLKYNFKVFLEVIIKRADAFTLKKFSLAYINGNFNEIYNAIKDNGKSVNNSAASGFGYSADELAEVLSNLRSE